MVFGSHRTQNEILPCMVANGNSRWEKVSSMGERSYHPLSETKRSCSFKSNSVMQKPCKCAVV